MPQCVMLATLPLRTLIMGSRPIYILLSVLLTSWEVSSEQALQRQLDSRGEATDATGLAPGLPARLNEALKAKQSLGSLGKRRRLHTARRAGQLCEQCAHVRSLFIGRGLAGHAV